MTSEAREPDEGPGDGRIAGNPAEDPTVSAPAGPEVRAVQGNDGPIGPRPLPDLAHRVLVMAIVNRTPDSFFDRGRTFGLEQAVAAGHAAAAQGADVIDVGGVKFAPGEALPVAEEIERVVPVVRRLREELPGVLLSVDTFQAEVARAAVAAGADIINDTTGLRGPGMAATAAATGATIVLTHSLAEPRTPLPRPTYDDVVAEVEVALHDLVERATAAGITRERVVLDPGPDLNKTTEHTLALLRGWERFTAPGLPLLAALSRKDVIGETLGLPKEERLEGSLAAAGWVIPRGARILRVHDVAATVRAARMTEVLLGWREPAGPLRHNV